MRIQLLILFFFVSIHGYSQIKAKNKNEQLVLDWFDAYNRLDSLTINKIFAPDFRSERNGKTEAIMGPQLQIYRMKVSQRSSPGRVVNVLDMFSQDEKVVTRVEAKGFSAQHQKLYSTTGNNVFIIRNGKIAYEWQSMDDYSYITQMGYSISSPASSKTTGWKMIYKHDKNGNVLEGSKEELLKLVRNGFPVRYAYKVGNNNEVEHFFPAEYITVYKDHVYAQHTPMASQRWDKEDVIIWFGEKPFHYHALVSTDGNIDQLGSFMEDGKKAFHMQTKNEVSWFVLL